jgi:hypothetical protein
MDTNTQQTHRHFLALPAFTLAMLLSVSLPALSSATLQATVLPWQQETEQGRTFVSDSLKGFLFSETDSYQEGDTLWLQKGSVLVSSEGMMHVVAGRFTVEGAAGSLHVTLQGDSLTVAALTSPALVNQGHTRVLIPAGYQWNSRQITEDSDVFSWSHWFTATAFQELPSDFLQEQNDLLAHVPSTALPKSIEPYDVPTASVLELPGSLERRQQVWEKDVPSMIRFLVASNDAASLQRFIAMPPVQKVLGGDNARTEMVALVATSSENAPVRSYLLPFLTKDQDLSLLLSVHPAFRASMGGLIRPDTAGAESTMLFVKSFPFAEVPENDVSPLLIEQWRVTAQSLLQGQPDEARFLLLQTVAPQVQALQAHGYPERAALYRDALLSLFPFEGSYPADIASTLQSLHALDAVSIDSTVEEPDTTAPAIVTTPASPEEAVRLEAQVRALLQEAGAAMTVQTVIKATSTESVSVQSVLFASLKGDKLYSFEINPQQKMLRSIQAGEDMLPYPMTLDAFLGWVRGE